jgi:predicted TIM-barrel fold metal-dependent hydrolase
MENICGEAEFIASAGLKGIKMHPDTQLFNIDDERLFPLYDLIQGKMPVMLHMGDKRYNYSHPARLRRVLELFPKLQVIATHFGGYSMYEEAYDLLHDKDCVFDVSSSLMFMPEGVAEKFINAYGAERMAFGTDYPLWDPVVETERFMRLKLTADQFDQIGHKTAERVLGQ